MKHFDVSLILARAKEILGVKSDKELGSKINAPRGTIASWRRRKSIPIEYILRIGDISNVSMDWLLNGRGDKVLFDEDTIFSKTPDLYIVWYALVKSIEDRKKDGQYILSPEQAVQLFLCLVERLDQMERSRLDWLSADILANEGSVYAAIRRQYGIYVPDPFNIDIDWHNVSWEGFEYL